MMATQQFSAIERSEQKEIVHKEVYILLGKVLGKVGYSRTMEEKVILLHYFMVI